MSDKHMYICMYKQIIHCQKSVISSCGHGRLNIMTCTFEIKSKSTIICNAESRRLKAKNVFNFGLMRTECI